jgi:catechol 2,3-dioxygenase-like lactoylglutathione lyase family enzyme
MAISDEGNGMTTRGFKVRALGEIAIRCDDLAAMTAFYEDIIGLDRLPGNSNPDIVFFRIAEGFGGHTSVLALFDKRLGAGSGADVPETGARSSLHHIALSLPFDEQEAAMRWYEAQGLAYRIEHFAWVGWRGVFTEDPEGNTVELVAYDPSLLDP